MGVVRGFVIGLTAALALGGAARADTQKFVAMAGGEKVGHLTAEVTGRHVTIDYAVVNNGRGPKAREQIDLDAAGFPTSWTIEGESLFGAPVHEHFTWTPGTAEWLSQADKGSASAPKPILYIGNDVSPWMLGVYVKALLKAPGHTLPVLPSGSLRVQEVKRLTLGDGRSAQPLTIYELSGIDLSPENVALDAKGQLFAAGGVIREGYEQYLSQLGKANREIAQTRAEDAQKQLAHRFTGPVRIRNVRIFDPVALKLSGPSQVVVYGARIATMTPEDGKPAPKGETVIDGQGGTLVPGLHDMHSHTSLASNLFNLAAGVTATRDMGNDNQALLGIVDGLQSGRLAGPRIVRNGFLEGRSPYSARNGFIADTLPQAIDDVHWYADHGYWQIKIYNSFPPDWVAPVAAEAHRLGMGVTGHVPAFSSPDRVIRDGYNDIAHINQLMLGWILDPKEDTRTPLRLTGMARAKDLDLSSLRVRTTIELMKSHHVALDTTTMTLERLMLSRSGKVQAGDAPYLDHVPIGYQRYRKRSFVTIKSPADDVAYQESFKTILQVMKLLDDEHIQMLPGTDDTTGFALLRELELYHMAGFSPARVLRMDTLDCEKYFGRDSQAGTIERGKLADFILVDGDPTADIGKIRNTRMTMVGGVAYYPSEIYQFLSIRPFTTPPPVTVAP
jgi:imidazolonepropionase-like amidohydrolase